MLFFITAITIAQVGINTTTPNGILEINSNNSGVVLPRLVLTATDRMAPATNPQGGTIPAGTVIYNTATTTNAANNVSPGIYVWNGTSWIAQFTKKQTAFYETSAINIRTRSNEGLKSITGLVNRSFTPNFSGNYKIELNVNYGGGYAVNPSASGFGYQNIAVQSGVFNFQVNNSGITNYYLPAQAYSTSYDTTSENGKFYFDIWEQYFSIINLSLSAGTPITFSLFFNQDPAPEFVNSGNSGTGMGSVAKNIPCTVEIKYIGQ